MNRIQHLEVGFAGKLSVSSKDGQIMSLIHKDTGEDKTLSLMAITSAIIDGVIDDIVALPAEISGFNLIGFKYFSRCYGIKRRSEWQKVLTNFNYKEMPAIYTFASIKLNPNKLQESLIMESIPICEKSVLSDISGDLVIQYGKSHIQSACQAILELANRCLSTKDKIFSIDEIDLHPFLHYIDKAIKDDQAVYVLTAKHRKNIPVYFNLIPQYVEI